MPLDPELRRRATPALVRRINELYHDLENSAYDERQAAWFAGERDNWRALAQRFLSGAGPLRTMDYGCGTGFVSCAVVPFLPAGSHHTCCDISAGILEVARGNVEALAPAATLEFRKVDGPAIPMEDAALDRLMLNAVLHHLPDLAAFGAEARRVLKPGGLLIVAHEPNADTLPDGRFRARMLVRPGELGQWLAENSAAAEAILRVLTSIVSPSYRRRNAMLARISETLLAEGLLHRPVRGTEIQLLVDIQLEKGLRRATLEESFPGFRFIEWIVPKGGPLGFVAERC